VTLDPRAGPSAKVFHEARERPADATSLEGDDAWLDTARAFQPRRMFLLREAAAAAAAGEGVGAGRPGRRVLVTGRGDRPLLIDPDARSVAAMAQQHYINGWEQVYAEHDGSVYLVCMPRVSRAGEYNPDLRGPHLYRIGFPELEPVLVMGNVPQNFVRFAGGRVVVIGTELWELELDANRVWPKATRVPWSHRNHIPLPSDEGVHFGLKHSEGTLFLKDAFTSERYGLVIECQDNGGVGKSFAVEFREPGRP
jgi:hypothetical protein